MATNSDGLVFDDDDAPPPRRRAGDPDAPRRKKKKPPRSLGDRLLKPAVGGAAALALLAVVGGLALLADALFGGPALIPPEQWQEQVLADRFKVLLPGPPKVDSEGVGHGMQAVMLVVSPDKNTGYTATITEGKLSPARAALTIDELLEDSCDGAVDRVRQYDPRTKEVSRTEISIDGFRGKEVVVKVPRGRGQVVLRVYWVEGRLFILSCAGKGLTADNANVKYLFNSFQSVPEGERKVNPKAEVAAAPAVTPPVAPPAPPPPPPIDPTLPKFAGKFALRPAEAGGVVAMGFTPDGKTLALGTSHGQAAWYDADAGKPLATRSVSTASTALNAAVSPQGDRVAFFRHGGQLFFFDRDEPGETVLSTGGRGQISQWCAAFAPGGDALVSTHGDRLARVWDVKGQRERATLKGFDGQVAAAAYSPDGKLPDAADSLVGVWDAKTLQKLGSLGLQGEFQFSQLRFSPDGATPVGLHNYPMSVWDLQRDPEAETVVAGHTVVKNLELVSHLQFSPDGKWLLAVTDTARVRVWDAKTLKRRGDLNFTGLGPPQALAFRPTDARLAVACAGQVVLVDLDDQKWD